MIYTEVVNPVQDPIDKQFIQKNCHTSILYANKMISSCGKNPLTTYIHTSIGKMWTYLLDYHNCWSIGTLSKYGTFC